MPMQERNGEQTEESGELRDETLVGHGACTCSSKVVTCVMAVCGYRVDRLLNSVGHGAEVAGIANLKVAKAPGALPYESS